MKTEPEFLAEPSRADWLKSAGRADCRDRIWKLGLLTGLKSDDAGAFTPANFERALVLDRLIELRKPASILEIGTGRGLGCLSMAESARIHGAPARITTLDLFPADAPQRWPIEIAGERKVLHASRDEIWSQHIDAALMKPLRQIAGPTTRTLPELARAGEKFDLIFIDAGHDLYSVVHDLAYSVKLLAPGGAILMDDFAPMEEFGLGTCIAAQHARRLFESVEIFPTEGLVFGGTEHTGAPRGMVLLTGPLAHEVEVSRLRLLAWRLAEGILRICHMPQLFPVRPVQPSR
jgi:predicted O-methyltransferase YrrM